MFWGLIMEPNKRYTQVVEKAFHISHAAMDTSTGDNEACQVMVVVDGKNFLICTLQKGKNIQVPLDLYFKAKDSISFLTNGKCNVHLTGYLDPEFEDDLSEGEEEEEEDEEEAPTLVPAKNKRKLDNSNDAAASKKLKQEKKGKKAATADSSDDEDVDQLQKFLDGEDIDTDDNDESFKVNTSGEADSDEDEDDEDEEEDDDDDDDDDEEEKDSDEAETTLDTSKDSKPEVDMSKLSKSQKRRLKKKLQQQAKEPQVNGVDKAKKEKPEAQQKEKKKPEKKEAQDGQAEKKEKKSLAGGIQIEDTKVGTGPVAKSGKVVMVYYEGRLKQNNKMFDNCLKGPGFKFRLGAKEVISGWDIGIAGMKVGGKRRITCPPAMAYGAKGSPPVIPPNSTLVFEVELKNVK